MAARRATNVTAAADTSVTTQADAFANALLRSFRTLGLAVGARLPSERILAHTNGCSRTVVRDALHRLEHLGHIRLVSPRIRVVGSLPGASRASSVTTPVVVLSRTLDRIDGLDEHAARGSERIEAALLARLRKAGIPVQKASYHDLAQPALRRLVANAQVVALLGGTDDGSLVAETMREHRGWRVSLPTLIPPELASLPRMDSVIVDQSIGARAAMAWLAARGARRTLVVVGSIDGRKPIHQRCLWWQQRRQGYLDGAKANGMDTPLIEHLPVIFAPSTDARQQHRWFSDLFRGILHRLHAQGAAPIDGILALSDRLLFSLTEACRALDLHPLLIGADAYWDDPALPEHRFCSIQPAATIDMRLRASGEALAELVIRRVDGSAGARPQRLALPPVLRTYER